MTFRRASFLKQVKPCQISILYCCGVLFSAGITHTQVHRRADLVNTVMWRPRNSGTGLQRIIIVQCRSIMLRRPQTHFNVNVNINYSACIALGSSSGIFFCNFRSYNCCLDQIYSFSFCFFPLTTLPRQFIHHPFISYRIADPKFRILLTLARLDGEI